GREGITEASVPVQVSGMDGGIAFIDAGDEHSCALTGAGVAWCWGDNYWGQLGDGDRVTFAPTPVAVTGLGGGVQSIGAGNDHSCAVTAAGSVKCWGRNDEFDRQLGNPALVSGPTPTYPTPMDVPG